MNAREVEASWERLLSERKPVARAALARQLRRAAPPSEGTLGRAITSADAGVRQVVAWVAGGLPWAVAGASLRKALQDSSAQVRISAVLAVAAQPGEEPAALLGTAAADPDLQVASTATAALAAYRAAAVEPLLRASRDPRPEVQSSALRSLAVVSPPRTDRLLQTARDALRAADEQVRAAACQLLGSAGQRDDAGALAAALADRSDAVRERAGAAMRDLAARG